jgi:hypothetical protein
MPRATELRGSYPLTIIIGSHLERKDPKARQILDRAAIPMLDRCTGVTVRC